MENYLVKKTYTDLILENSFQSHSHPINKKRKYDEFAKTSPTKKEKDPSQGEINKKRKLDHVKTENKSIKVLNLKEVLKISKFESKTNINTDEMNVHKNEKNEETNSKEPNKEIEIPKPNKITKFFKSKPSDKKIKSHAEREKELKENPSQNKDISNNETSDLNESFLTTKNYIWISSINLGEKNKFKLSNSSFQLGKYKYLGEKYESIEASEYIVILKNFNKLDLKYVYALINKKKFIYFDYFLDSSLHNTNKEISSDYIYKSPKLSSLNEHFSKDNLPFQKEKYKIFLHPSIYSFETKRKDTFISIFKLLGIEEFEDNIRQSDICIINKINNDESYPPQVKLLNELYVIDCFYNFKVMDVNNWKYQPMLENSSKK